MGFRFRRSVRILPGVRLNFSPRGVSTTLGIPGLSVGLGKRGTHLNVGLVGTGLSHRQRLDAGSSGRRLEADEAPAAHAAPEAPPTPAPPQASDALPEGTVALASAAVDELGSESMGALTGLIREAVLQQRDAEADLRDTQQLLENAERRLERARRSPLSRWVFRSRIPRAEQRASEARTDYDEARRRLDSAPVDVDFDLEAAHVGRFEELTRCFQAVAQCAAIWDATSQAAVDQRGTRSAASHAMTRQRVTFAVQSLPAIRSRFAALRFGNANGEDVHILPAIVLIGHPERGMAVLDVRDVSIGFQQVTCIGDDKVPSDALVVGKSWDKVNKDGTPDRRFRDNRERPLVAYGELTLRSPTGLHEVYLVSLAAAAHHFSDAFDAYKNALPPSTPDAAGDAP